jgi:hypothetical protein
LIAGPFVERLRVAMALGGGRGEEEAREGKEIEGGRETTRKNPVERWYVEVRKGWEVKLLMCYLWQPKGKSLVAQLCGLASTRARATHAPAAQNFRPAPPGLTIFL